MNFCAPEHIGWIGDDRADTRLGCLTQEVHALSDVAPDRVETSLLERRDHLAAAACWLPNFAGELWQMRNQCSRYPCGGFVLVEWLPLKQRPNRPARCRAWSCHSVRAVIQSLINVALAEERRFNREILAEVIAEMRATTNDDLERAVRPLTVGAFRPQGDACRGAVMDLAARAPAYDRSRRPAGNVPG